MIDVSNDFKLAMKQPVKELDAYIRIDEDNQITSADNLISIKISCDTGMCKTAMRKLEAKYTGDHNLVGQIVHVGFGVRLPNNTFEYLDYGSFLITEITFTKDTNTTTIVGYDKMINTMVKYDVSNIQYPISLYDYTNILCNICGLELGNNSFVCNNNWEIERELWENIDGITYRDIFQQIAQATGTTCIIGADDKVYFKALNNTGEQLTYDNLMKLKLEPIYGEINRVILGRQPITGEDIPLEDEQSIIENGLTEFRIDNNEIVDKDRENAITPIYNQLHGISYYPFEATTEGLGWYEIADSFNIINDVEDVFNTSLFNFSIQIDGGITETLKSVAESKTQSQYQYTTTISKRVRNAEILVNKQDVQIKQITSDMEGVSGRIAETIQTVEGTTTKVQELEHSIQYFTVETDISNINILTDTSNNPLETTDYYINFISKFKGEIVIPTINTLDEHGGITVTFENTKIKFSLQVNNPITEENNKYIFNFEYENYVIQKTVIINTVKTTGEDIERIQNNITRIEGITNEIAINLNNDYYTKEQIDAEEQTIKDNIQLIKEQTTTITTTAHGLQVQIDTINENGVKNVKNTTVDINENGITVGKSNSEFSTTMNNEGTYMYAYGNSVAKYDKDGGEMPNLKVTEKAYLGYLRIEKATVSGEKRTHIHWIGG